MSSTFYKKIQDRRMQSVRRMVNLTVQSFYRTRRFSPLPVIAGGDGTPIVDMRGLLEGDH